jgi:hypothetical protein
VPHPRGLREGGVFDFRPYAAAVTRIDSHQQDLFLASVLPDARNRHRQSNQPPLKIVKDGPPGEISTSPLVIAADPHPQVARPRKVTFR